MIQTLAIFMTENTRERERVKERGEKEWDKNKGCTISLGNSLNFLSIRMKYLEYLT